MGYQSLTVKPDFNLISLNFNPINGESVDIQDFISSTDKLIAGTDAGSADRIQIWDGTTFTTYIYQKYKSNNPNKFTDGPAWVDLSKKGTTVHVPIKAGVGVWFARPTTAPESDTITIAGQVGSATANHQINPGFNMIGSAFPCDIVLNADDCPIKWSECAVAGTDAGSADRIQIWNGTTFTTYIYQKYKSNNPNKFTDGPGWVDLSKKGEKVNVKIDAGTGIWYARPEGATAGTLPQTSPIAK